MAETALTLRCPGCGTGHLLERENRQNGSRFMGCSEFPRCRHSEPLPAYLELKRAGAVELPGLEG